MTNTGEHILVSLLPRHAENIVTGYKRVELRRRSMKISPGTIVWLYSKLPVGAVVGRAQVIEVYESSPVELWRRFADVSGLSKDEFLNYFDGVTRGVAVSLSNPVRIRRAVTLGDLRRFAKGFQPPQFFLRLKPRSAVLARLTGAVVDRGKRNASSELQGNLLLTS